MSATTLRLYSLVNFYMGGIHAGIQTQHAAQELTNKYIYNWPASADPNPPEMLRFWSLQDKTTIVLNGGMHFQMEEAWNFLESNPVLNLPYAKFHESQEALGGIMTAIAIIIPESIYDAKRDFENREFIGWKYDKENETVKRYPVGSPTANFLDIIKSCQMAK